MTWLRNCGTTFLAVALRANAMTYKASLVQQLFTYGVALFTSYATKLAHLKRKRNDKNFMFC